MREENMVKIEDFLSDVRDQIRCKPARKAATSELEGHILEKAASYEEEGMEEDRAVERAIRDMGDASAVGSMLDGVHRPRTRKPAVFLIGILVLLGIGQEMVYGYGYPTHFFWGLIVLTAVTLLGYPLAVRHTFPLLAGFIVLMFCARLPFLLQALLSESRALLPVLLAFPASRYLWMLLSVPLTAALAYKLRRKGVWAIAAAAVIQLFFLLFNAPGWSAGGYAFASTSMTVVCMLSSFFFTFLYLVMRRDIAVSRAKGSAALLLCVLLLTGVWAGLGGKAFVQTKDTFLHPENYAYSTWEDAYNNLLIRELLGRARAVGPIRLTASEAADYGTGKWYFVDGPGKWEEERFEPGWEVKPNRWSGETPTLEEILPQHRENYHVAWWILRYGWAPAVMLILLQGVLYGLLFKTALRMRNSLGRVISFSCCLMLSLQFVFYIAENMGFQFGAFTALPFISEGINSITANMAAAGMILSSYRYDMVEGE